MGDNFFNALKNLNENGDSITITFQQFKSNGKFVSKQQYTMSFIKYLSDASKEDNITRQSSNNDATIKYGISSVTGEDCCWGTVCAPYCVYGGNCPSCSVNSQEVKLQNFINTSQYNSYYQIYDHNIAIGNILESSNALAQNAYNLFTAKRGDQSVDENDYSYDVNIGNYISSSTLRFTKYTKI